MRAEPKTANSHCIDDRPTGDGDGSIGDERKVGVVIMKIMMFRVSFRLLLQGRFLMLQRSIFMFKIKKSSYTKIVLIRSASL